MRTFFAVDINIRPRGPEPRPRRSLVDAFCAYFLESVSQFQFTFLINRFLFQPYLPWNSFLDFPFQRSIELWNCKNVANIAWKLCKRSRWKIFLIVANVCEATSASQKAGRARNCIYWLTTGKARALTAECRGGRRARAHKGPSLFASTWDTASLCGGLYFIISLLNK